MRPEKANIVSELSAKLNQSPFVLVTDYQHMKVDQFDELRNRLAPAGAQVRVVKNSFLKRAMAVSLSATSGNPLAAIARFKKLFFTTRTWAPAGARRFRSSSN